ncbi:MAG: sporulation protein YabP [Christensenellaceae bacterium]|nr:sporulation protein YabP [Christensenellaceae bacterium]
MNAQEDVRRIESRPHKVSVEGKERVSITSVEDIDSFNENEVILLTGLGMMTVVGEDLHISKLDLEEGLLVVDGSIQALDYADHEEERMKKRGLFSKVFR